MFRKYEGETSADTTRIEGVTLFGNVLHGHLGTGALLAVFRGRQLQTRFSDDPFDTVAPVGFCSLSVNRIPGDDSSKGQGQNPLAILHRIKCKEERGNRKAFGDDLARIELGTV